ncbi:MAG: adenylyl-sulfate kinase [Candidatus Omnitrophica bacterium]|nr:adenylyl-sulfate kinase [Candidatus Omnitrophota bacterium]
MNENIIPHEAIIKKQDRWRLNQHKSVILWFTGLSGSGKSTLSHKLEAALYERGVRTYVLDGDNVRKGMNKDLGFAPEDRKENIRRIGEMTKLFMDCGIIMMTAFISPYREDRAMVRSLVEKSEFVEVYMKCSVDVCERRDVKGLYKKARAGEIKNFTGISAPYEEPQNPEIVIESDAMTLDESVAKIVQYLEEKGCLKC